MAFDKYEGQRPRGTKPIISIRKNGQIAINSRAVADYGVDKYAYADLYYDKEKELIAIDLTNVKTAGTRKITMLGGTALIAGGAFMRWYGIPMGAARKFEPTTLEHWQIVLTL